MKKAGKTGDISSLKSLNIFAAAGIADIINAKDAMGRTPLHIASFYCHKGNVDILFKLGADTHAEDNLKMVFY